VIDKLTFLGKDGILHGVSESKEKSAQHHQQQQQQQQQHQNLFKRAFGVRENARVRFLNGRNHSFGEARIENHAFEDIRDEDL